MFCEGVLPFEVAAARPTLFFNCSSVQAQSKIKNLSHPEDWTIAAQSAPASETGSPTSQSEANSVNGFPR
jgi:hypothetical protein